MIELTDVECTACGASKRIDATGRLRMLQLHGHARKMRDPQNLLVNELFQSQKASFKCWECSALQMKFKPVSPTLEKDLEQEADDEFWGGSRRCTCCNSVISADRLDALPSATTCIACAQADVCASVSEIASDEYCPKCGSKMVVAANTRAASASYSLKCTSCRYSS
jgi:ssDNA-binding Zn-finger/Zn-ribbon topoisomerase 1